MSYQHSNRLLAHWEPKRRPEGAKLSWGSRERYEKISASAGFVACVVASHLNDETNSYEISNKTLLAETGLGKSTVTKALTELLDWGVLTRTRVSKERPYRYFLAITCPPECERLNIHNTASELASLPAKQSHGLLVEQEAKAPTKQATRSSQNRQLIDKDKNLDIQIVREIPSICSFCHGERYRDKVIHQQVCPQYQKLSAWKPWQITKQKNFDNWPHWDYRERQIATFESLREFDQKQIQNKSEADNRFNQMLADQAGDQILLPAWREWLKLRVSMYPASKIAVKDLRLALQQSSLRIDLEDNLNWMEFPHNQPHEFYKSESPAGI